MHMIESLEPRVAPASLTMGGRLLTYTDSDGDLVRVAFSNAVMAASDFDFGADGFLSGDTTTPQQLDAVDFIGKTGAGLALTASRQLAGDGHAKIGLINGMGTDLGEIRVDGDVGRVVAGDDVLENGPGISIFAALNLGKIGISSEVNGLGSLSLSGNLNGVLNIYDGAQSIVIHGSVVGSETGSGGAVSVKSGGIDTLKIGGSLYGNASGTGNIEINGDVKTLTIGGSVIGAANNAGLDYGNQVSISGHVDRLIVGGDVAGQGRHFGGKIVVGSAGVIKIGGSVMGSDVTETGILSVAGDAQKIAIGGDLRGATAWRGTGIFEGALLSGAIFLNGSLGDLEIGGDLIAYSVVPHGGPILSGVVDVGGVLGNARIGGNMMGSPDVNAMILAGGLGSPTFSIGNLEVRGNVMNSSILAGRHGPFLDVLNPTAGIGSVQIGGDFAASFLIAGDGPNSGATISGVKVDGRIFGLEGSSTVFGIRAPHILSLRVEGVHYGEADLLAGVEFSTVGFALAKAEG